MRGRSPRDKSKSVRRYRRNQDPDNDIQQKTSVPRRWSKLAIAMRDRQRRDGRRCRRTFVLDATARNHRDGAQPDSSGIEPCHRERQCASPARLRPQSRAPPEPQPRLSRRRPNRACCRSSPISSPPSPSCPTRKSAVPAAPRSAISCFPSRASPARASRRARRAGRSSAASTSTASASSRTAPAPAAPPISARIISCRSIRSRPTRSKSSAGPRRCATARPRSAASSAPPTTAFRMRCPPARQRRSRLMDCL